tara:strand:- start:9 stop:170 length:162 start_codon:yes stop_codon:yes gene_type:complete
MRLLLIIIIVTQLGCASIFWQTAVATLAGNVAAEIIMEEVIKKDDEKEKPPEK